METTLTRKELEGLAIVVIAGMSLPELIKFVARLIPVAEAAKAEGANGPQPFRN